MKRLLFLSLPLFLLTACNEPTTNQLQGYVEGDYTYISSPFAGKLTELAVARGQTVKKNQLLFKLDNEPQYSKKQAQQFFLREAKFTLANLKKNKRQPIIDEFKAKKMQQQAELNFLNSVYQRNLTLFKSKVVDANTLEASKTKLQTTKALIDQIDAQIENALLASRKDVINAQEKLMQAKQAQLLEANWALKQKTARAPYGATVVDTYYRQGEFVNMSLAVLSLLAETNKHIIFFIPADKLNTLALGQQIQIHSGEHKSQKANVNYIAPNAEYTPPLVYSRKNNPKLVFKVRATPSKPTHLHPGEPVMVELG